MVFIVKEILKTYYAKWYKHLTQEMIDDIYKHTSFLDYKNADLKERTFYYIREKSTEDTCIFCGNILKFHR